MTVQRRGNFGRHWPELQCQRLDDCEVGYRAQGLSFAQRYSPPPDHTLRGTLKFWSHAIINFAHSALAHYTSAAV